MAAVVEGPPVIAWTFPPPALGIVRAVADLDALSTPAADLSVVAGLSSLSRDGLAGCWLLVAGCWLSRPIRLVVVTEGGRGTLPAAAGRGRVGRNGWTAAAWSTQVDPRAVTTPRSPRRVRRR